MGVRKKKDFGDLCQADDHPGRKSVKAEFRSLPFSPDLVKNPAKIRDLLAPPLYLETETEKHRHNAHP
jgi:hypothetical protein